MNNDKSSLAKHLSNDLISVKFIWDVLQVTQSCVNVSGITSFNALDQTLNEVLFERNHMKNTEILKFMKF
ncbi:CLUMA_CG006948, isoform A [Clunio marinus]|uniref:CLUMA_CG006948, isoform A n=1 Tax=Clunio marinus TaxID=568069 RepID=A0A1J1I1E2_9DIPT|nr:CLUMA_CG006948, isoform A [Clunio marinus]